MTRIARRMSRCGGEGEEASHTLRAHLLADSCDEWSNDISQLQRMWAEHRVIEDPHTKLRREIEKSEWRAGVLGFPGACLFVYVFACEALGFLEQLFEVLGRWSSACTVSF